MSDDLSDQELVAEWGDPGDKDAKPARARFTAAERQRQTIEAFRLFMSGAEIPQIAEVMGVSYGVAYARVQRGIDDMRPHADYDRYRAVQLAELEVARRALRQMIVTWAPGKPASETIAAIGQLLRLQEREAKLLGLDRVPTPFDHIAALSEKELEEFIVANVEVMQNEIAEELERSAKIGEALQEDGVSPE